MRWKRVLLYGGSAVGIFLVGVFAYVAYLFHKAAVTADSIYEEVKRTEPPKREDKVDLGQLKPISLLLLGVDERPESGDPGRSDAILYVTLNPQERSMYILSIQRDIRVPLKGVGKRSGTLDKINHAYAYGGPTGSVETVENFLGLPVDYYIAINFQGFADLVDLIGGITVDNPVEWTDPGYYKPGYVYRKGPIQLENGEMALGYIRMRYWDPEGDIGRNARERQVLQAILQKASRPEMILKLDEFLNVAGKNMKTNLTYEEMQRLIRDYRSSMDNVHELAFDLEPLWLNNVSYQKVKPESYERVTATLREHLGILASAQAEGKSQTKSSTGNTP